MAINRFFCSLSGEDYSIIRKSPASLRNLFFAIGVFVFFVFVTCAVSLTMLFSNLFDVTFFAVIFAIFLAWMVTNIYLLILYTLSKRTICEVPELKCQILPNLIKYGFIIFMALLVTKPIEVFVFSSDLGKDIKHYKAIQLDKYTKLTSEFFDQESNAIKQLIQQQKDGPSSFDSNHNTSIQLEKILLENEKRKKDLISKMEVLISKSSFYIQRIILLCTKYPKCWLVSLFVLFVFMLPAIMKHLISSQSEFYKLKKNIETKIVLEEYMAFKEVYNQIIQGKFGAQYKWGESHVDPPFNTIRIEKDANLASEDDFIRQLYHD